MSSYKELSNYLESARKVKAGKDAVLNSLRKKYKIKRKDLDRYWEEAVKQADKKVKEGIFEKSSSQYYAYVTSIVKKRAENAKKPKTKEAASSLIEYTYANNVYENVINREILSYEILDKIKSTKPKTEKNKIMINVIQQGKQFSKEEIENFKIKDPNNKFLYEKIDEVYIYELDSIKHRIIFHLDNKVKLLPHSYSLYFKNANCILINLHDIKGKDDLLKSVLSQLLNPGSMLYNSVIKLTEKFPYLQDKFFKKNKFERYLNDTFITDIMIVSITMNDINSILKDYKSFYKFITKYEMIKKPGVLKPIERIKFNINVKKLYEKLVENKNKMHEFQKKYKDYLELYNNYLKSDKNKSAMDKELINIIETHLKSLEDKIFTRR